MSVAVEQERQRRRRRHRESLSDDIRFEGEESSGSAGEGDSHPHAILADRTRHRKTGQTDILSSSSPTSATFATSSLHQDNPLSSNLSSSSEDEDDDDDDEAPNLRPRPTLPRSIPSKPALPPYVDARPTIRTYFKIYSPSRGGRMLSVYESAPDRFNYSQSWGWKSLTLMLEDGCEEGLVGVIDEADVVVGNGIGEGVKGREAVGVEGMGG